MSRKHSSEVEKAAKTFNDIIGGAEIVAVAYGFYLHPFIGATCVAVWLGYKVYAGSRDNPTTEIERKQLEIHANMSSEERWAYFKRTSLQEIVAEEPPPLPKRSYPPKSP